jgi:hypothetical protein
MTAVTECALKDAPCVRAAADAFHEAVLKVVEAVMLSDPAPGSAEGGILTALAEAVEAYEKAVYPV